MEMRLENVTEENCKTLSDIYNYYVENTTATYAIKPVSVKEFIEYYKIDDRLTTAKAIIVDGDIAGFCLLRPWNAKKQAYEHTYEYSVYLKPDCCKNGIGKRAYKQMEEYIAAKKIRVVIAGVCADNTASCKMCEALGFEKCGHFKKVGVKFGKFLDLIYYQKIYE